MFCLRHFSLLGLFIMISASPRAESTYNYKLAEGPNDSIKLITPRGEYVIANLVNGIPWIGKPDLFEDCQKGDAEASDCPKSGHRNMRSIDDFNDIDASPTIVSAGTTDIEGIAINISFTGKSNSKTENVEITWQQSNKLKIAASLAIEDSTLTPRHCKQGADFYQCSFAVNRDLLNKGGNIYFFNKNKEGASVRFTSLAVAMYDNLYFNALYSNEPFDNQTLNTIKQLHLLDMQVPLGQLCVFSDASDSAPQSASTPQPPSVPTPPSRRDTNQAKRGHVVTFPDGSHIVTLGK